MNRCYFYSAFLLKKHTNGCISFVFHICIWKMVLKKKIFCNFFIIGSRKNQNLWRVKKPNHKFSAFIYDFYFIFYVQTALIDCMQMWNHGKMFFHEFFADQFAILKLTNFLECAKKTKEKRELQHEQKVLRRHNSKKKGVALISQTKAPKSGQKTRVIRCGDLKTRVKLYNELKVNSVTRWIQIKLQTNQSNS